MTYTEFAATAELKVPDDFNLEKFLRKLSRICVNEENFIYQNYGSVCDNGVDIDFNQYITLNANDLKISVDTEELNGDSEVFDWLFKQFIPVMTSLTAKVTTTTIDGHYGISSEMFFITQDNTRLNVDDLLEVYFRFYK